ncbi:MAG: iron-containing alcohol dehydrogenase [Spirochaetales bacterium]|nr:iron-containing alcohol dehydrogenase [Spirochaetales bacterium]
MVPEFFQFHSPVKIIYGFGIIDDLSVEFQALQVERLFLLSDPALEKAGILERVRKGLQNAGLALTGEFLDIPQDSDVSVVRQAAAEARESGAQGLLAVGGGSVIDTAKAANIVFTNGGDLIDDFSGAGILEAPLNPLVVIPTTAGTGSEATLAAVIYDRETKTKLAFSDKYLLPHLAVLDPELTLTLPPALTASTGMDALTHAIESTISIDWSPVSRALAFGAVEMIFASLKRAVTDGSDLEARGAMLVAANMAGIAFSHSMVGCVHSMAHATGGLYRVPHGTANAILLPYGMEYNFQEGKEVFSRLAPLMGVNTTGLGVDEAAQGAIDAVRNLVRDLGRLSSMPVRLRDAGVPEEGLELIAEHALEDGSSIYNPREMEKEALLDFIRKAY